YVGVVRTDHFHQRLRRRLRTGPVRLSAARDAGCAEVLLVTRGHDRVPTLIGTPSLPQNRRIILLITFGRVAPCAAIRSRNRTMRARRFFSVIAFSSVLGFSSASDYVTFLL